MGELLPGQRPLVQRTTIAAVVLVVFALVLAAGVGTAAGEEIDVNRTTSEIEVTVHTSTFENVTGPTDTVIRVKQASVTREVNFSSAEPVTRPISVTEFGNASGDLSAATVIVEANGTNATASGIDLRYVERGGRPGLQHRTVELPVTNVVGIADGKTVGVTIAGQSGQTSVEGIYQSGQIDVPISKFRGQIHETLTFTPLPGKSNAKFEGVDLGNMADASLTPGSDTATLSHPFFFADESYSVSVTTSNPGGLFSRTITASGTDAPRGSLSLPAEILYAQDASIEIRDPNENLVYSGSGSIDEIFGSAGEQSFRMSLARSELENATQPPIQNPSSVWIRNSSSLTRYDGSRFVANDTFDYGVLSEVGPEGGFTALLIRDTDSAVLRVSPDGATDDLPENGAGENGNGAGANGNDTGASGNGTAAQEFIPGAVSSNAVLLIGLVLSLIGSAVGYVFATKATPPKKGANVAVAAAIFVFGPFAGWEIAASQLGYVVFFVLFGVTFALVDGITRIRGTPLAIVAGILLSLPMFVLLVDAALPSENIFWVVDFESPALALAGIAYGVLFAVPTLVLGLSKSTTQQSAQMGGAPPQRDVTLTVRDETESPIPEPVPVTLTRQKTTTNQRRAKHKKSDTKQVQVDGGSARVSLPEGTWKAKASYDGNTAQDTAKVTRSGVSFVLEFPAITVGVEAVDRETGEPISGADLTITANGQTWTDETDRDGRWRQAVSRSTREVTVEIDHWRYEAESWTTNPRSKNTKSVQLRPLVGTLEASVTLDGRGVPDIPVEATHQRTGDRLNARTDREGRVTFRDVPIGEYHVEASLTDRPDEFSAGRAVARVRDGRRSEKDISIQFDYGLAPEAKRRLRSLEEQIDEIGAVSRRDSAIPNYYASVLQTALAAVEDVPDTGYPLLTAGIDPETVVDALLTAVEEATDTVERVMNSKRNVDLFSACSDFADTSVTWSGTVSIEHIAELSQKDIGEQRGLVLEDLEAVDDHISEAVGEVAEVSPAREMWEGIRTMARDNTGTSQVESAALIVVAQALLDAIEALFEQDQLRKRLERTVY